MFHERLGKSEYVHIFDMNFRWYVYIMNIYESYIAKLIQIVCQIFSSGPCAALDAAI